MNVKFDELQLKIMKVLWKNGEASVSEINDLIESKKKLAHTTIATVLVRLQKKKKVSRYKKGRKFVYKPLVSEADAKHSLISSLTEQFFQGDPSFLVNHLVDETYFTKKELKQLRDKIDSYTKPGSNK